MMIPCEKVNHSLAIAVLGANLLLLRLWVSLIRSPAPCWDLLQHQDILVMFFKSDCIRLDVLQIQITPHTDAAVFSDNERNFKCFRNSFAACDANCCVYQLSHFQSQGLERSERGPDEVWGSAFPPSSENQQSGEECGCAPRTPWGRVVEREDRGATHLFFMKCVAARRSFSKVLSFWPLRVLRFLRSGTFSL